MPSDKIWIVIPAFNEGKRISKVIEDLRTHGYENIVIVDDGSSDSTYSTILRNPVHALRHPINRGQGAALKTGIDYALEQGADIIVTFDSDGQHRASDIPSLLRPIQKSGYEVALGSRFLRKNADIPIMRKILLKGSILVILLFYGVKMSDAHNGLRALSRRAAERIEIRSDRMEHASEIIDEITRKKIKYKEIPVTISYSEETMGKGHGSFGQALKVLIKMILRKLMN